MQEDAKLNRKLFENEVKANVEFSIKHSEMNVRYSRKTAYIGVSSLFWF